jgi:peptidyl-prolyl cis-trans isomerase B (cyclophilin B)
MLATLGIIGAAILAFSFYLQSRVGGTPGGVPSPGPSPTPSTLVASTCSSLSFGPLLLPLPGDAGKHTYAGPPSPAINTSHKYLATVITNRGTITLCLDPALAPNTVNNFVFLARNQFYNGLKWHRVVANFVIQGGDPLGTGSGGPGYKFNDEPVLGNYTVGALAMANSGANTNGSQFFICTVDDTKALAKSYNLFGYVASGMDVVLKIVQGDVMTSVTVQEQS